MATKTRVFFFHYNKPSSQRVGKAQISVHYKDTCHIVDNVICNVPTYGHLSKRQPRFVMKGKATKLVIENNIAKIY